jgi:hypothetical protein
MNEILEGIIIDPDICNGDDFIFVQDMNPSMSDTKIGIL